MPLCRKLAITPRRELGHGCGGREGKILIKSHAIKEMKLELHKAEDTDYVQVMVQKQVTPALSFRQFPLHFICIRTKLSQCQLPLRMQVITVVRKVKLTVKRKQRFRVMSQLGFNLFSLDTLTQQSIQWWYFFLSFLRP